MYHNCNVIIVDTVVVDWRLQEIGVLLEPAGLLAKLSRMGTTLLPLWKIQRSREHFDLSFRIEAFGSCWSFELQESTASPSVYILAGTQVIRS